ncbi:PLP-dependent transferase [Xylaria sp. FL1777]|nr:PLP-dependent transferase [Xylaria sp. FL1777]
MLSARGERWAKSAYAHGALNRYNPVTNPEGVVGLDQAENVVMQPEVTEYINSLSFDPSVCRYGEGYTGTLQLRKAMANHLNEHFAAARTIDADEITFAAGVTYLNEACALVTCNPEANEAIMLANPVYGAFSIDLCLRTGVDLEGVSVGDADQFSLACVAAFDAAFEAAKARGRNIRALMICNPHNPLGRCYPRETLVGLLQLCARKGIHLISDEIYALSVYERSDRKSEAFTSVLSIDLAGIIDPKQVHVLYGMSKDFSLPGTRLGCVISQNSEFNHAVRAVCRFASPSQYSMYIAASFLGDQAYVRSYLKKARASLWHNRQLAESLLSEASIDFYKEGNAGLFIWVDLSSALPLKEANGDGWLAERLLLERLVQAGVSLSPGKEFRALRPGRFRLVFSLDEETLREGIKRISRAVRGISA